MRILSLVRCHHGVATVSWTSWSNDCMILTCFLQRIRFRSSISLTIEPCRLPLAQAYQNNRNSLGQTYNPMWRTCLRCNSRSCQYRMLRGPIPRPSISALRCIATQIVSLVSSCSSWDRDWDEANGHVWAETFHRECPLSTEGFLNRTFDVTTKTKSTIGRVQFFHTWKKYQPSQLVRRWLMDQISRVRRLSRVKRG